MIQVLCSCGWGLLSAPEDSIPERCPLCGYNLRAHFAAIADACEAEEVCDLDELEEHAARCKQEESDGSPG